MTKEMKTLNGYEVVDRAAKARDRITTLKYRSYTTANINARVTFTSKTYTRYQIGLINGNQSEINPPVSFMFTGIGGDNFESIDITNLAVSSRNSDISTSGNTLVVRPWPFYNGWGYANIVFFKEYDDDHDIKISYTLG